MIRTRVARALESIPPFHIPGPLDAMRLVEEVAFEGVRFPAAMLMFRKATFTLDGVLADIAGRSVELDGVVRNYAAAHWLDSAVALWRILAACDWIALQWSALTFAPRWTAQVTIGLGAAMLRRALPAFAPIAADPAESGRSS